MTPDRPWPPTVPGCGKCKISRDEGDYRARGLCNACYHQEKRRGLLHKWVCVQSSYKGPANLALRACMTVGKTQVSKDFDVSVETLEVWIRRGIPKKVKAKLYDYVTNLQYLSGDGSESDARQNLFPQETERQEGLRIVESLSPDWV